jgi:hypothetical protein
MEAFQQIDFLLLFMRPLIPLFIKLRILIGGCVRPVRFCVDNLVTPESKMPCTARVQSEPDRTRTKKRVRV